MTDRFTLVHDVYEQGWDARDALRRRIVDKFTVGHSGCIDVLIDDEINALICLTRVWRVGGALAIADGL